MKRRHHREWTASRLAACRVADASYANFSTVRFTFAQLFFGIFGFGFTPMPI